MDVKNESDSIQAYKIVSDSFFDTFIEDGREISVEIDKEDSVLTLKGFVANYDIAISTSKIDSYPDIRLSKASFGQVVEVPKMWYEGKSVSGSLGLGFDNLQKLDSFVDILDRKR